MPGVVVLQGPKAPADCPLGYCLVCASVGKFLAMAEIKDEIGKHERTGTGVKTWGLQVPREYLQRAVAWQFIPQLSMAGPVCWTHVMSIQPASGGIIPVQGGLPAGLGGTDGIPLLGGG